MSVSRVLDEKMWACSILKDLLNAKKVRIGGYNDWENGNSMITISKWCHTLTKNSWESTEKQLDISKMTEAKQGHNDSGTNLVKNTTLFFSFND